MKKILFVGGGTAGHIMPLYAVIEKIKDNKRIQYLMVGQNNLFEKNLAEKYDINFKGILAGKWRNYFSFLNFSDLIKSLVGFIQSFCTVIFFRPNLIFAKGGFVSLPIIFWAKLFKMPYIIHESDVIMGKTNRFASNGALKICVGFPLKYYKNLPLNKLVFTGTPVTKEFFKNLEIEGEKDKILITGGSQGAQKINNVVLQILPELCQKFEIIHLTGKNNFEEVRQKTQGLKNYQAIEFSDQMAKLMKNSKLIIARAGANTLSEIAASKKASILIPLQSAQNDHQTANAKVFEESSAAVVLKEKNLTGPVLLSIINHLMADEKLRQLLAHHAAQFSQKDSAAEIVDIIFNHLEK